MPSSSATSDAHGGGSPRRVLGVVNATWMTLFGLFLLTAPWWAFEEDPLSVTGAVGFVLFGLAVLSILPMVYAIQLRSRRPQVTLVSQPQRHLTIRLEPARLAATAVLALSWAVLVGFGAVVVGANLGGALIGVVALLFLALFLSAVPSLFREAALVITDHSLTYTGWSVDAHVDWVDVEGATLATPHRRRPVARVLVKDNATTYRWHRQWRPFRTDLAPEVPAIDIPLIALDEPAALLAYISRMAGYDEQRRRTYLDHLAVEFLEGRMVVPPRPAAG